MAALCWSSRDFPDDADDFTIDGCMWGNEFCNSADEEVKLEIEEFNI